MSIAILSADDRQAADDEYILVLKEKILLFGKEAICESGQLNCFLASKPVFFRHSQKNSKNQWILFLSYCVLGGFN